MPRSRGLPAYFARIARETPKREQIVDTPASVFPRARVASWGTKSITGTARASSSLHQLAVWPPRTATRGNRWGDTHVGSAGGPEGASEAGVSGRFLPFLVVFWPLRARNGQKRPETACRRSVTARPPRPCLGAVGDQLTLHGSLEKRRNESKLLDQQPANSYDGRWQMASTAGRSIHADRSIDSLRKIHRKLTQNAG